MPPLKALSCPNADVQSVAFPFCGRPFPGGAVSTLKPPPDVEAGGWNVALGESRIFSRLVEAGGGGSKFLCLHPPGEDGECPSLASWRGVPGAARAAETLGVCLMGVVGPVRVRARRPCFPRQREPWAFRTQSFQTPGIPPKVWRSSSRRDQLRGSRRESRVARLCVDVYPWHLSVSGMPSPLEKLRPRASGP